MTPGYRKDLTAFLAHLPIAVAEAGRLGLFKTQQKLHEAVRVAGFEAADRYKVAKEVARGRRRK